MSLPSTIGGERRADRRRGQCLRASRASRQLQVAAKGGAACVWQDVIPLVTLELIKMTEQSGSVIEVWDVTLAA
jgi:hypothetical protein